VPLRALRPPRCCRRQRSPTPRSPPSHRRAARQRLKGFENTCVTSIVPSSFVATALLSPPEAVSPQVTTEPSARNAAKDPVVRKHLRHVDRAIEFCRHGAAVAAIVGNPPGHHRAIGTQRGKGTIVPKTPASRHRSRCYPTNPRSPPSHRRAARQRPSPLENTCVTSIVPSSFEGTALLSPP
jgi:hypothetical protein